MYSPPKKMRVCIQEKRKASIANTPANVRELLVKSTHAIWYNTNKCKVGRLHTPQHTYICVHILTRYSADCNRANNRRENKRLIEPGQYTTQCRINRHTFRTVKYTKYFEYFSTLLGITSANHTQVARSYSRDGQTSIRNNAKNVSRILIEYFEDAFSRANDQFVKYQDENDASRHDSKSHTNNLHGQLNSFQRELGQNLYLFFIQEFPPLILRIGKKGCNAMKRFKYFTSTTHRGKNGVFKCGYVFKVFFVPQKRKIFYSVYDKNCHLALRQKVPIGSTMNENNDLRILHLDTRFSQNNGQFQAQALEIIDEKIFYTTYFYKYKYHLLKITSLVIGLFSILNVVYLYLHFSHNYLKSLNKFFEI